MKSAVEVVVAVKECRFVPDQDLRLALLVMVNISFFTSRSLERLCEAVEQDKPSAKFLALSSRRLLSDMFAARKAVMEMWLGPSNIPGTPEQIDRIEGGKKLFKAATGVDLDKAKSIEPHRICALMLDAEEFASLLTACDMFSKLPGESPYLDALKRVTERLKAAYVE